MSQPRAGLTLSLLVQLDLAFAKSGTFQLKQWPEHWEGEPLACFWQPILLGIPIQRWLDEPLSTSESTMLFSAMSQQLSDLLSDSKEGREIFKALIKTGPLNKPSVLGAWQRLSKWLDYVAAAEFPVNLHSSFRRLVQFLQDQNPAAALTLQQTLACLQEGVTEAHAQEIQEIVEAARKQEHRNQNEGYQEWLHQGAQGSLKPITGPLKRMRPKLSGP